MFRNPLTILDEGMPYTGSLIGYPPVVLFDVSAPCSLGFWPCPPLVHGILEDFLHGSLLKFVRVIGIRNCFTLANAPVEQNPI